VDWNRRELLAGLGVGAASTLLATLGCGAPASSARRAGALDIVGTDVRGWLRQAVEQLRTEFPVASAQAVVGHRVAAAIDLRGRGVVRGRRAAVVLRVEDRSGHVVERATGELSAEAVSRMVSSLRRTTTAGRDVGLGEVERHGPGAKEITGYTDPAWLELVSKLSALADPVATSRVVYRGAWLESDDLTIWQAASGPHVAHVREQRLVRSRGGLVLMSWSGTLPMVGQIERGAVGGPDRVVLSARDVAAVGRGALELTTPGTVPAGAATVLLMPSVVARLAGVAIAPILTTAAWRRADLAARTLVGQTIGSRAITVSTDPDPARYGGYYFDDEGASGTAAALIDAGVLRAPVGDRRGVAAVASAIPGAGLRPGHTGVARPAIGHLAWAPGTVTATPERLVEDLTDAWIVDDAGGGHVEPAAWSATIEIGRARRVKRGAETGHVHAGVELTASIPELLAAATAVSSTVETFVERSGDGADVHWRSLEVPAIVTRATLAPRRPG